MPRDKRELQAREREVRADFSKGYKYSVLNKWNPTFLQRLKMLLGFDVVIAATLFSEHKPGRVAAIIIPQVTEFTAEDIKKNPSLIKIDPPQQTAERVVKNKCELTGISNPDSENPTMEKAQS